MRSRKQAPRRPSASKGEKRTVDAEERFRRPTSFGGGEGAPAVEWTDSDKAAAALARRIRKADWAALDTEADSLHSYPEKLCLVQLAAEGLVALVDPLAGADLRPLWAALKERTLILHGCDYDLRLLRRAEGFVPSAVFDTMLAARFLGFRRFGLESLLKEFFGVELDKKMQRADWSRRPLSARMIEYAAADVRRLKPLADILSERLEAAGRAAWHREMCERAIRRELEAEEDGRVDPWRLKGSAKLGRLGLATLRELWLWRDQEARRRNRPPFFVAQHDALLKMAELAEKEGASAAVTALPPKLPRRVREGLGEAVRKALALPEEQWPTLRRRAAARPRPTRRAAARFEALQARRDRVARDLGIEASFLAPKALLLRLAADESAADEELMDWQRKLLLD